MTATFSNAFAGDCINWPRVMSKRYVDPRPASKAVVINKFDNFLKSEEDAWLSTGIRNYLFRSLSSARGVKFYVETTLPSADVAPEYTISGQFQRHSEKLRVFITLAKQGESVPVKQMEVTFPYPNNKEFFARLSDASIEIIKTLGTTFDSGILSAVTNATESTKAYEAYSRGLDELLTFSPARAESAKKWFEDAKKYDFRSPLGFEGLVEMYAFMGFAARQRKANFTPYFHAAEKELAEMSRLAKPAPLIFVRKKAKVVDAESPEAAKITHPLLLNNISFQEGLIALNSQNPDAAVASFKQAVAIIPEDALSWYYLASALGSKGDFKASSEAMQNAKTYNSCVE